MKSLLRLVTIALTACVASNASQPPLHEMSTTYDFTITPTEAPPRARDAVEYSIMIVDRKTRQPIENGDGRLFGNDSTRGHTWDGMTYGPQVGVYHAKLSFVVSGLWAMAVQFRSDSLRPLERVDWYQDVLAGRDATLP